MGVFDLLSTPEDPTERLIDSAIRRYMGYQAVEKGGESILNHLIGDDVSGEEHQDRVLGIALKKRALGLPYDSEDFNEATNQGLSFSQKGALAAFGHKASELIPDPKFLTPKHSSMGTTGAMGFPLNLFSDTNGLGKSKSLSKAGGLLGAITGVSSYGRSSKLGRVGKYFRTG